MIVDVIVCSYLRFHYCLYWKYQSHKSFQSFAQKVLFITVFFSPTGKMRFILFSLSIGTLCVLASSAINDESINSIDVDPRFDARVSDLVARNVLELAHDIGTRLLQRDNKPNQVISPLSIFAVLSQLLLGSNGETNYELMNLLKFDGGKTILSTD